MPRLIRDITESEKVNKLSFEAEVFFNRLMMKADDYGNFHGNIRLVRAALYPLKLDTVRDADVVRWISECKDCELIRLYGADGKSFIHIVDFGQRLKRMKRSFPEPPLELLTNVLKNVKSGTTRDNLGQHGTTEDNARQSGTSFYEVEEEVEEKKNITLTRSFFRLKDKLYHLGPGDFFRQEKAMFLASWEMTHPHQKLTAQVLERMNKEYVGQDFNSENHMVNTFKSLWNKVLKDGPVVADKPRNIIGE